MTATTPASQVIALEASGLARCPNWCTEHAEGGRGQMHTLDLPQTWGATTEPYGEAKLGLALEREDTELGAGEPRVNVQFSQDGVLIDGAASLRLPTAESYAYTILRLVAEARAA